MPICNPLKMRKTEITELKKKLKIYYLRLWILSSLVYLENLTP